MLTRVSVMVAVAPDPARLLTPTTAALVHANVAVVLELNAVYVFDILLHQLAIAGLVITGDGFTVTATSFIVPAQPLTVGVIR